MKERGINIIGHAGIGMTTVIECIEAKTSHKVTVIEPDIIQESLPFKKYHTPLNFFIPPLTRAQRRKLKRKK